MRLKLFGDKKLMKILGIGSALMLLAPAVWLAGSSPPAPPEAPAPVAVAPSPPSPPAVPALMAPPSPPEAAPYHGHKKAWLGVFLSDEDGVRIVGVREGSPAEKGGLKKGDWILEIDGQEVENSHDLHQAMRDLEPGDDVQIRVERRGGEETLSVTLEEWPRKSGYRFRFGEEGEDWEKFVPEFLWSEGSGNYIGVHVQNLTDELRDFFRAPEGLGLLVSKVVEDTPAQRAGLKAGDVIIEVDGKEIENHGDISRALADHEPGDTVAVRIVRNQSEQTLDVEIAERPGRGRRSGNSFFGNGDVMLPYSLEHLDEELCGDIRSSLDEALRELELSREGCHQQCQDGQWHCQEALAELAAQTQEQRETIQHQLREALEGSRLQLEMSQAGREELEMKVREAMERAREAMERAREMSEQAREENFEF